MSNSLPRFRARAVSEARHFDAALTRDLLYRCQLLQAVQRSEYHVVRIGRAQTLGENVGDSSALHDRAHRTTSDYTGTRSGGLHQNLSSSVTSHDLVRNRSARHRNAHHVATRYINGFPDGFRDFVRLSGRKADAALAIANRDQRVEGKATPAFHDFGDAVDCDHVLDEIAATIPTSAFTVAAFPLTASAATLTTLAFAAGATTLPTRSSATTTRAWPASPTAAAATPSPAATAAARTTAAPRSLLCR